MTPGGVITVGAVVGFVGWLGYGIWFRDWLESRRCIRLLEEMAEKERRADELAARVEAERRLAECNRIWAATIARERADREWRR